MYINSQLHISLISLVYTDIPLVHSIMCQSYLIQLESTAAFRPVRRGGSVGSEEPPS